MGFLEALATMGVGKLIVVGIFGILALILIVGLIIAVAAVLGPGMQKRGAGATPARSVSVRVLGFGIVSLTIGSGIVVSIYALPMVTTWGTIGVVFLSAGIGLVIFYLVASRVKGRAGRVPSVPESE